jgi:hypothetical protein
VTRDRAPDRPEIKVTTARPLGWERGADRTEDQMTVIDLSRFAERLAGRSAAEDTA